MDSKQHQLDATDRSDGADTHTPPFHSFAELAELLGERLGCDRIADVGMDGSGLPEIRRERDLRHANVADQPSLSLAPGADSPASKEIQTALPVVASSHAATLLTCVDRLDHVKRDCLVGFLWGLREMCSDWLLTSISNFPCVTSDGRHSTIIPRSTWLKLLKALGFTWEEREELVAFEDAEQSDDSAQSWLSGHWQDLNPFRNSQSRERHVMLLRNEGAAGIDFTSFSAEARKILGAANASVNITLDSKCFISFLIGHYQGFLLLAPLFEILPRDSYRVLLRSGPFDAFETRRRAAVLEYFASRDVQVTLLDSATDDVWATPPHRPNHALVTAIDSTVTTSHLINSAFVVAARQKGILTFQIQHGIWPHAEFHNQLTVLSDFILTWSPDLERSFVLDTEPHSSDATVSAPRHTIVNSGCPRFDTYQDTDCASISELLGDWTNEYDHTILLATNLHWPLHTLGSEVLPQLSTTARKFPNILFLCKLHPAHDYDDNAFRDMPSNVVVIDEFTSLYGELTTPRLVKACDAVICTLSTVALEAALANKPLAVLETGNPNAYTGLQTVPIAALAETIQWLISDQNFDYPEFLENYYSPDDRFSATDNVLRCINDAFSKKSKGTTSEDIAIQAFSQAFLIEREAKHHAEKMVESETLNHTNNHGRYGMEADSLLSDDSTVLSARSQLGTLGKVRREVLRVVHQITRQPSGPSGLSSDMSHSPDVPTSCGCAHGTPTHGDSPTPESVHAVESCVQEESFAMGAISNRDQLPKLLSQLNLNGIGIELGVAAAEYSDQILKASNLRVLFSVDRWSDHHNDEECEFASRVLSKYGTRSSILRMTFDEAVSIFADRLFDFIYIDGYAHCGQDGIETLNAWWPKLKPGGIFAGHDYDPEWPKTMQVVDQFVAEKRLHLYTTAEDPRLVKHAYASWYTQKPDDNCMG